MKKINPSKDIGIDKEDVARYTENDKMAEDHIKKTPSKIKIKIKAYDECIEIIDKFIREKQKTRNIFYVSDLWEIRNRITELEEAEDEKAN